MIYIKINCISYAEYEFIFVAIAILMPRKSPKILNIIKAQPEI